MTFTIVKPNYFNNYLEKLPQNAHTHKKFSYDPWVSDCPALSLRNIFDIIRFILSYPFTHLHDFWKARQVRQNYADACTQAIQTLRHDAKFNLPILALAILRLKRDYQNQKNDNPLRI